MTGSARRVLGAGLAVVGVLMGGLGLLAWDFGRPIERQVALVVAGLGLGAVLALGFTLGRALSQAEADQRSTERTLAERETFLKRVAEASPMTIFAFDLVDQKTVYSNNRISERLGYDPAEIDAMGDNWLAHLLHPEDRPVLKRSNERLDVAGEHEVVQSELRFRRANGRFVWFSNWMSVASRTPDGRARLVVGASVDVTERKRAEAALEQSEARFRMLAEHAHDIISRYECFPAPHMAYISPSVEKITGYAPERFYQNPNLHAELVHPEDRAKLAGLPAKLQEPALPIALRWVRRDGEVVSLEHRLVAIRDERGELCAIESISRDVTDKVRLEEQLLQSQKMEAIGRLAGGIAHDFNNLLGVTLGYVALLKRAALGQDGKTGEALAAVEDVTRRAADLTRQLLTFGRRELARPQALDLNAVVLSLDPMLRRVIPENIELRARLEPGVGAIEADPGQVEQMLLNLVVNARDAMPRGGTLTIETLNADAARARALLGTESGGEQEPVVVLSVHDTGVGMSEQTRLRAFEPYFTTKERGKGTGLGLATVYGIMQQSGGAAVVQSQPGTGTVISLVFPRKSVSPQAGLPPPAPDEGVGGSETVLVVEDEAVLRRLIARTLTGLGYAVLDAADGERALELSDAHGGRIDLLLTDVVMPRMSGLDLAERMRERRPVVCVVYMSGYAGDEIARHGLLPESVLLAKPFTPDVLARIVRRALDAARRAASA